MERSVEGARTRCSSSLLKREAAVAGSGKKCHLRIELQGASVTWLASQTGSMCLVPELPAHTSCLPPATPHSPPSHVWKSAKSFTSSDSKLSSIFLIITQLQQDKWLIFYFSLFFLSCNGSSLPFTGSSLLCAGLSCREQGLLSSWNRVSRTHKLQ